MIAWVRCSLFESPLQMVNCRQLSSEQPRTWVWSKLKMNCTLVTYQSRVKYICQIGCLINCSSDDVIVGHRCCLGGWMTVLLSNYIQNRVLNMQQNVFDANHITEIRKGTSRKQLNSLARIQKHYVTNSYLSCSKLCRCILTISLLHVRS